MGALRQHNRIADGVKQARPILAAAIGISVTVRDRLHLGEVLR